MLVMLRCTLQRCGHNNNRLIYYKRRTAANTSRHCEISRSNNIHSNPGPFIFPSFPHALANIPSTKKDTCEPQCRLVHITSLLECTSARRWTHIFPSYRERAMISCYLYLIFFRVYCQRTWVAQSV
jgi:hypothetical protein